MYFTPWLLLLNQYQLVHTYIVLRTLGRICRPLFAVDVLLSLFQPCKICLETKYRSSSCSMYIGKVSL